MEKTQQENTIQVMVAKRRSVDVDGRLYGPGAKLALPISEAKSLYEKGFIVEPDDGDRGDTDPATAGGDGAGLSIQTGDQEQ